jgi:hypothetical protein
LRLSGEFFASSIPGGGVVELEPCARSILAVPLRAQLVLAWTYQLQGNNVAAKAAAEEAMQSRRLMKL